MIRRVHDKAVEYYEKKIELLEGGIYWRNFWIALLILIIFIELL